MENTEMTNSTSKSWLKICLGSPLLWGAALTTAFYSAIPLLTDYQEFLNRYFCNHPLEYATTFLFFVGMSVLLLKAIALRNQKLAFELNLIAQTVDPQNSVLENAQLVEKKSTEHMSVFGTSWLLTRFQDVGRYIVGRGNGRGLEEHLKYLAELALEELYRSYALLRTITWAVPILGFLGTVVGITLALANIDTETIQTQPDLISSSLAIAFDTTALSLTLSLVLVFGSLLVERAEQSVMAQIESFGVKMLLPLLAESEERPSSNALLGVETEAAQQLLQVTEELIGNQTEEWNRSLDQLRHSWVETVETQKAEFETQLHKGMQTTLQNHSDHLLELRGELVSMVERLAERIDEQQVGAQEAIKILMDQFVNRLELSSDQISNQLEQAASGSAEHLGQLREHGDVLLQIVSEEKELNRLQESLSNNLELVRSADTFEETLHSLNAAVSLLTVKARRAG